VFPGYGKDPHPAYLQNFSLWSFPDEFKIYNENMKIMNKEPGDVVKKQESDLENRATISSFVMTDENYNKRYCTTIEFYEKFYIK